MNFVRWLVVLVLFLIATAVGGAVARIAMLFAQLQAMIVLLLVAVLLILVAASAAKSGRWLANPYW